MARHLRLRASPHSPQPDAGIARHRRVMRTLLLTLFLSLPAAAEIFSIGGIIGTPLTDVTQTTTVAGVKALRNSNLYTIGPTVQVNLPLGLRLEADALYRPVAYQLAVPNNSLASDTT